MKDKKYFRIFGAFLAFMGVALVRLLTPQLSGVFYKVALVCGYLLSLAGIIVLAYICRPAKP
jgi:hypothetical protein